MISAFFAPSGTAIPASWAISRSSSFVNFDRGLVAVARGGDRLRIVEGDQVGGLLELFQNEVAMGFQDRAGSNVLELHVLFLLSNGRHADQAEVTLVE